MKLYVCYGTFPNPARPGGHPCRNAYKALRDAGHDPEVIRSFGMGPFPWPGNMTAGRREAKRLTGSHMVPVLVTDDGEAIGDSKAIIEWARANPASATAS